MGGFTNGDCQCDNVRDVSVYEYRCLDCGAVYRYCGGFVDVRGILPEYGGGGGGGGETTSVTGRTHWDDDF